MRIHSMSDVRKMKTLLINNFLFFMLFSILDRSFAAQDTTSSGSEQQQDYEFKFPARNNDILEERNSQHHIHPYQYAHVQYPGVFEWGYNRGNPHHHTRTQFLKQKHHNHFQSQVRF